MAKCTPSFENPLQLKQSLIDLMRTRGKTAQERLEREHGGIRGIVKQLHTSTGKGLIGLEDDLKRRADIFGANFIAIRAPQSFLRSLGLAFTDSVLIILIIGAVVSLLLGYYYPDVCEGKTKTKTAWMEGCGILGTVIVTIVISAFSDYFQDRNLYKMQEGLKNERKCFVVRSGNKKEICYKQVQVGDVCVVKIGSIIPADGVVVQNNDLVLDESSLSGPDAMRVFKSSEDPLIFAGTHVTEGSGRFVVLAVGENTQTAMASSEADIKGEENAIDPDDARQTLQGKLNKASAILGLTGIILGVVAMVIIMIRFSVQTYAIDKQEHDPSHWVEYVKAIIIGVVVIIIAEPEGLSLAVAVSLAHCIQQMHSSKIFVRNVDAVEMMGNVTTICCSKTGVLTELNTLSVRERVAEWVIGDRYYRGDPKLYRNEVASVLLDELCTAVALNTSYTSDVVPVSFNYN